MDKKRLVLNIVTSPAIDRVVLLGGGTDPSSEMMGGLDKSAPDTFCGNCGVRLTFGLAAERLREYAMRCTKCGAFNQV